MTCEVEQAIEIKTGSAGIFYMEYTDDQDPPGPISLNDYEIYMDFVNPKTGEKLFRGSLDNGITITDMSLGKYTVNAGDTANFPLGKMPVDIKYVLNGIAQHTETFIINFIKGIT